MIYKNTVLGRPSFNSKLVRLKVVRDKYGDPQYQFQFQTGAIKRTSATAATACQARFQFQTGAIKSYLLLQTK